MFDFLSLFHWIIGNKKGDADTLNKLTATDYYDRLKLIALSIFEWKNLPPSCNSRYLEKTLFQYGRAIFVNDEKLGFLNMKATPSGKLNHYDEPLSYTANSTTYNEEFSADDCVIIRNNLLERPTDVTVTLFASRLTRAERTIDVNVDAQKTPVIILCDEKERLTLKNVYKDYQGNEPVIFGSKTLNIDQFKVLKTDAPFVANDLQKYKHEIWNEALTFFGINNTNSDKRERLTDDEVNANNELIFTNAQAMLLTRQDACKEINAKYGLDISVEMRKNPLAEAEGREENEDGEV